MKDAILNAREKRYQYQKKLLKRHNKLITFSLTPPGNRKVTKNYTKYFSFVSKIFEENFKKILFKKDEIIDDGGYQTTYFFKKDISLLKKQFVEFENIYIFNIIDIDIITVEAGIMRRRDLGLSERKCIVCKKGSSKECFINENHSISDVRKEYLKRAKRIVSIKKIKKNLKRQLKNSLFIELTTTPKYGLVDLMGKGIHKDMDFKLFEKSIDVICNDIDILFDLGINTLRIREKVTLNNIRKKGKIIEDKMFKITKGINTLKGGIFIYSLIFFSIGFAITHNEDIEPNSIFGYIKNITNKITDELSNKNLKSFSRLCYDKYNVTGIRGEVENGLSSVRKVLNINLKYQSINELSLRRFLYLFKNCDDTQVIKKIGLKLYRKIQKNIDPSNCNLNEELEKYRLYVEKYHFSAGGVADLLSVVFFMGTVA